MRIPAELRANPEEVAGLSIRELATPGRVTVGLADWALVEGGGIAVAGVARQPVAVGVTRLERRGSRIWGVPVRGLAAVQPEPKLGLNFQLGSRSNAPSGVYASGSFVAPVTGSMRVWGAVDNFLQINGQRALSFPYNKTTDHYRNVVAGEVQRWSATNTGGFAGGSFGVAFSGEVPMDWRSAVAVLQWAGASGTPWWSGAEASAKAGLWVRRLSWTDGDRKIRYVAGLGTTRAVAVDQAGVRLTAAGFGAAEFLAEDWVLADGGEPAAVDVTDWIFSGGPRAVAFAVAEVPGSGPGDDPADPDDVEEVLPPFGDYVRMVRNGVDVLAPVRTFGCGTNS